MIEWQPVTGSGRIVAEAYVPETETILVRFTDGKEYFYAACSSAVWEEFTAPGQSRGKYIAAVLNDKPKGPWTG